MGLSTHVLDTALGRPAAGVRIRLSRQDGAAWQWVGEGETDADGRCRTLLGEAPLLQASYRLHFETAPYFARQHQDAFFPYVEIVFDVQDPAQHHHVPLLLAPFGYSTYRGS